MKQYILLMHENLDDATEMSPDEMQATIERYGAWARELGEQGRLVSGEKLADDAGRVLKTVNGEILVSDGPYSETKDVIGGYFIIRADTYEEAAAIARECPHAQRGLPIELRHLEFAEG